MKVYTQVWSKADHFRWGLGQQASSGEEATIATKNVELGFVVTFISWTFSERAGFGERGMRFSRSCRSELEVPAEHRLKKNFSLFMENFKHTK